MYTEIIKSWKLLKNCKTSEMEAKVNVAGTHNIITVANKQEKRASNRKTKNQCSTRGKGYHQRSARVLRPRFFFPRSISKVRAMVKSRARDTSRAILSRIFLFLSNHLLKVHFEKIHQSLTPANSEIISFKHAERKKITAALH